MTIGILALQGDFAAHGQALDQLAQPWHAVRRPQQLAGLSALVIPGGESSTLLKLMAPLDFASAIEQFHHQGNVLFGTCAGLILLAHSIEPKQLSLDLIDLSVKRNGYGRQLESFINSGELTIADNQPIEMVFIRAPKITKMGAQVETVATYQQEVVAARQGRVLVSAFHPEMSKDLTLYRYFLKIVAGEI
ncbi:MAG: pyridoxal 5'-phosphate synthase glutaminase subunit PdxT [Gammaproteobacteria bacterium]|nr:pyridoxal 5'-phosphate synthase glutaminase subunit PdxT [Gammaproteobacteria bacterium]